ncbi:MAG: PilZ domain-containing protein [Bdellovibrionota bacterium]
MRGYGPKRLKQPQQRKEPRKKIPFQRVSAEILVESTKAVLEGRVFLNDLSPNGVGCFVNTSIDKGEKISLVIEQPKHLYLKGEVMWCTPYTTETKILRQEQFQYRIGIKFHFDSPEEAQAVHAYCQELYAPDKS